MTDARGGADAERQTAERLGAGWNAHVRGDPDAGRLMGQDGAVVRAVHALGAVPGPDPDFLVRLKEDLMRTDTPATPPTPWPTFPHTGGGRPLMLPRRQTARWWTWRLAAAALMVVGIGLAVAALRPGGDDGEDPTLLPAYGAATASALGWQETPACDVPARSLDSLEALLAASQTEAGVPRPPTPSTEPGQPADAATVAAIEATARELAACRTERKLGEEFALWTDAAVLRAVFTPGDPDTETNLTWLERLRRGGR